MAYFSNNDEYEYWAKDNCHICKHWYNIDPETPGWDSRNNCPIEYAHLLYNYEECNKKDSILDSFIPRTKNGLGNEQCTFFIKQEPEVDPNWLEPFIKKLEERKGVCDGG